MTWEQVGKTPANFAAYSESLAFGYVRRRMVDQTSVIK